MATKKLTSTVIKKPTVNAVQTPSASNLSSNLSSAFKGAAESLASKVNGGSLNSSSNAPLSNVLDNFKPGVQFNREEPVAAPTIDTSAYDRMIAAYEAKMRADAEAAKKAKAAEYDSQAKAAYIACLQNERTLSDNLARAGIRGGTTETTGARLLSNYENNRNQIEANKSTALTGIDKDASDKIFQYTQAQEAAKLAYLQAREAEARQIAETQRQEKWTASQNAIERAYNSAEAEKGRQFTASQNQAQWAHDDKRSDLDYQRTLQKEAIAKQEQAHKERAAQIRADYIATVEQFDTEKRCKAEIQRLASLKKKGKLTDSQYRWRVQYVQLRAAQIRERKREEEKAKKK